MAGKIPAQFIDELMTRIDIVDVIDARVPLKKGGRDYMACCPFHTEKTPSFTVSQTKQFYHCFGCGAHGTAIGFLMDYEHMGFVDAVQELAARVGMTVPREALASDDSGSNELYEVLEAAATYYRRQLREHAGGARAIEYLKKRGLSGEIAATFAIGYAPPGWDNVLRALGGDAQHETLLLRAGLLIDKPEGGRYDRFRDRIMFPIHDRRGRIIGFGGRVLDDSTPKYLNSPETPVFHKGRELYGLYLARARVRQLSRLLVVEGYMDVVALAQYDIHYAVATLGTATTSDHLEQLYRATPEVVFCFDGDRAGRAAAWRALETALPVLREGRQARFLFLPDGEDPDSMVRKEGKDSFEARLNTATPLSRFFFDELAKQVDTDSVDGRARLAELAKPLLSKLPDGVFRQMMLEQLSGIVQLGSEKLAMLMGAGSPQAGENRAPLQRPVRKAFQSVATKSLVQGAVALLLHQPALAQQAGDPRRLADLDVPGMALLIRLLDLLQAQPHLSSGAVLEHWRDTPEAEPLMKLAARPLEVPEDGMAAQFADTLDRLEARLRDQRMEQLLSKGVNALSAEDKVELERLRMSRNARDRSGKT
ncbi:MAG: DNA primase [Gammaproteobacteria bacterium]